MVNIRSKARAALAGGWRAIPIALRESAVLRSANTLKRVLNSSSLPNAVREQLLVEWIDIARSHIQRNAPSEAIRNRVFDLLLAILQAPNEDTSRDPVHLLFQEFVARVNAMPRARVLEIGSRARSGVSRRELFERAEYVGLDVHPGANVDIVGDAHDLAANFPPEHFDAVFSISVFEHLAMPWKVVLELNRVLRPGGLLHLQTHPTWPEHDLPWDFWRYTRESFSVLLNSTTGFQLERSEEGLPCAVLPLVQEPPTVGLWRCPANLAVGAIAHKIGQADPHLAWNVQINDILATHYPAPAPL
jgi:SAM-dependent methyltransferase